MKYPFVKQQGIEDCAVASIQMLLKYYKVNSNYQLLINQTKVTKEGTTAYHIIKTLHEYGFDAKGMKLELNELEKLIKDPFIAHTRNNNFNHFIVVYKINKDKKTLIIGDPNDKIKTITYEEFGQIWTKVIITVVQVIKLKEQKKTNSILLLIKQTKINIKKLIATSSIIAILSIINSYYFMHMMNNGNLTKIFVAFIFIKIFFEIIRNNQLIKIKQEIDEKITNESFERIIELPYKYYENRTSGELVSKINDLEIVKSSIIKIIFIIFLDLPLTIISFFFLLAISKTLLYTTIIIYFIYFLIYILFSKKIKEKIEEIKEEKAQMNSFMTEMISSYETVKAQGLEKKIIEKFKILNKKYLEKLKKFDFLISKEYHTKELVTSLSSITIIFIGFYLIKKSIMTLDSLITFNAIMIFFLEPIKNIIDFSAELKETKNSIIKIEELNIKEEETSEIEEAKGSIEIRNLNYTYNDITKVLNNINLTIQEKEKIMLFGKSGTGKSTLLKIILKYINDYNGEILVNKKNIKQYNYKNYRSGISYISQKEVLFNATIEENIGGFDQKLIETCQMQEYFSKYDRNTIIKPETYNISGGEKQRLVLMRALNKDFNILIIDEGFSEIDLKTERIILKNIFDKYKEKTIIIVSHRMDNKDLFDRVCYI